MDISDAYELPKSADMPFAYTAIDAVYIWTHGGYQVARSPTDYPLFIAVDQVDLDEWIEFFETLGLPVSTEWQRVDEIEGAIQFVLQPAASLDRAIVDGHPVIPLDATVWFAEEHYATFQPALEMLDEMYDDDTSSIEMLKSTRTANERFGEEDMAEWLEYAVDPEDDA